MATRATYQFMTEDQPNQTVYIHNDNYPRGAAEHLQGCSTADELLAKNSRAEITDGHESYGDTEWRYNILKNQKSGNVWISVFMRIGFSDDWKEVFYGVPEHFNHWAQLPRNNTRPY